MAEEEEILRESDVIGTVYDRPQDGLPHLTAIFIDGKMVFCEPVPPFDEAEALLGGILPEIPAMVEQRPAAENANTDSGP
jgi:hypothetical protein